MHSKLRWSSLLTAAWLLLSILGIAQSQMDLCSDGQTIGYSSLDTLVNDEVNLPASSAENLRGFVLCPNTVIDSVWTPIMSLGSIVLLCGSDGNPNNNCTLPGVVLSPSPNNTYVSIVGVTFTGFEDGAISGSASSNATIEVKNSVFQDFDARSIIEQQPVDGTVPFKVELKDVAVVNGGGGVAFSNAGGELSIEGLTVSNSSFAALVATGSSAVQEGSTFLRNVRVSDSDIQDIFVAMEAGDIDAIDVTVTNMRSMRTVFNIRGSGSFASIDALTIADHDFRESGTDSRWIGIDVTMRATTELTNLFVSNSSHVRHVVSSSSDSSLRVSNSKVTEMMGGRAVNAQDVSAVAFANSRGEIVARRFEVENIDMFTSIFFGNAASNLDVSLSCVGAGAAQAAVYASEETTTSSTDNFIDTEYTSLVCPEFGKQLVQENPGSGCFQTNRTDCSFECQTFFEAAECLADTTDAPSALPSMSPSTSFAPVVMTSPPTVIPTLAPSLTPTLAPTGTPSIAGTVSGTQTNLTIPSIAPTKAPTFVPQINATTLAPTPPRAFDATPIPAVTSAPAISLVTTFPVISLPGAQTLTPGRDIPSPSESPSSEPSVVIPTITLETSSPTARPTTFLSTLLRPSPLLIPKPPGATLQPSISLAGEGGQPTSTQAPNAAQVPTLQNVNRTQDLSIQPVGMVPTAQQANATQMPATRPLRTSSPMHSPSPPSVPSTVSPVLQSSTLLPTSKIVASPSQSPVLQSDATRSPSMPSSSQPSFRLFDSSFQPTILENRHKPSYIAYSSSSSDSSDGDCDCEKSSKKKGKSSNSSNLKTKGMSKGKGGKGGCHCSKGKKSGKGSGKGHTKKGHVRQNYQLNHALHGLRDD